MNKLKFKIARFVSELAKLFIPVNQRKVVFSSFPDLSDNSWALFKFIYERYSDKKLVWLVSDVTYDLEVRLEHYPGTKMYKRKTLKGWLNFVTAKLVFHTHGIYSFNKINPKSNKRIIFNLWHGMPIKQVGILDRKYKEPEAIQERKSHFSIATSDFYRNIIASSFAIPKENVFSVGLPRNDVLINGLSSCKRDSVLAKLKLSFDERLIVWLPTYRQSIVGDIRSDSNYESFIDELGLDFFNQLDYIASVYGLQIIIKLHPMDILNSTMNSDDFGFKKIRIISASSWQEKKVELYDLLAISDLMITDLSSALIDALSSKVKVATTSTNFNNYTRDVIPNIYDLWAELPKIEQAADLLSVLSNFKGVSPNIAKKFNSQTNGTSSEDIFKIVQGL